MPCPGDKNANNVTLVNFTDHFEKWAIVEAVVAVGHAFARISGAWGLSPTEAFIAVYENITFRKVPSYTYQEVEYTGGCLAESSHSVRCANFWSNSEYRQQPLTNLMNRNMIVHELGHLFSYNWLSESPPGVPNPAHPYNITATHIPYLLGCGGWPIPEVYAQNLWNQHPCEGQGCEGEVFADMFLGWVFNVWSTEGSGPARRDFMNENMPLWLAQLNS